MNTFQAIINLLNILVSFLAIGTLVYFHGYAYSPDHLHSHIPLLIAMFSFFLIHFFFRLRNTNSKKDFLRKAWFEVLIYSFFLIFLLHTAWSAYTIEEEHLRNSPLPISDHSIVLILHFLLALIVGIELGRAGRKSTIWRLPHSILFILSYLVLVIVGSSILMLPEMTSGTEGITFVDALFTSVSANCVTGLVVVDTGTFFTLKGQLVLMVLIQLGGLNIIVFATFFISKYSSSRAPAAENAVVGELLGSDDISPKGTTKMLKQVIWTALLIEFVGAVWIYLSWGENPNFETHWDKIYFSVFHSISAFNNAGFSLFSENLNNPSISNNFSFQLPIAILIILGATGFNPLKEVVSKLCSVGKLKWDLSLDTKIAMATAFGLILVGTFLFFIFQFSSSNSISTQVLQAFFQSVTARTAGFNTIPIENLGIGTTALLLLLMFIGASSGSTGGGIKTSTSFVLLEGLTKKITRKKMRFSNFLYLKAFIILGGSLLIVTIGTISLIWTEPGMDFQDLLFEEVSAFGTVGLSRGITRQLSIPSKGIVMLTILLGRIGPLALAYTLFKKKQLKNIPKLQLQIG